MLTAQITLQSTDYALSATTRDSAVVKFMRKAGAAFPTKGVNQTWDYSAQRDSLPELYYFGPITVPVTTPRPAAFAGATLQGEYSNSFQAFIIPARTYYQSNSTGYGEMGDSTSFVRFSLGAVSGSATDSLTFPAEVHAYATPFRYYRFPMTMSTSWAATNRITTNFLLKVGAFGLNNTPGQNIRNRTSHDTIVGWGTLKLRNPTTGGVLNFNVLLDVNTQIFKDSFFLGGAPAPPAILGAFGLTQGQNDTLITYKFIGAGFKGVHLAIETNNRETQISRMFRAILPSQNLPTDLKNGSVEVATSVFPNPTTEGVTFEFDKKSEGTWRVFIYNEAGQIIKNENVGASVGKTQHTVKFEQNLANGLYFYQIIDNNSLIRNTGKVLLNR